jgi:hypothetical protein
MLKTHLKKGVRVEGLFELIADGKDPLDAHWTVAKNIFSSNVIRFAQGTTGGTPIKVLPYKRGQNSSTPMAGTEVISGEFSGCIMGVYTQGGAAMVNHVDTEKDGAGEMPLKVAWEQMKASSSFQLLNEFSTKGVIPGYIEGLSEKKIARYAIGIVVLCVASPTATYEITRVIVFRNEHHAYQVLDVA